MIKVSVFILLALSVYAPISMADFEKDLSATGNITPELRALYARAATGDANSQLDMGMLFFRGKDVERDEGEAHKWFGLAANQGLARAQVNLGMMYATGIGVKKNYEEAFRWQYLAAIQGLAIAQANVGVAYATGQGISKNESVAAKWFRLAANQGEAHAQYNLGVMYAYGQGVVQNLPVALRYIRQSAAQNHEAAQAFRAELNDNMTYKQIADADKIPDSGKIRIHAISAVMSSSGTVYAKPR